MNKFIPVVFWMRAISCLGIVMIHSISITLSNNPNLVKNEWPTYLQVYLMFATPMFVFITEFLTAYKYGDTLKEGFFKKRLIILGIPYVLFNIFWTFSKYDSANFVEFINNFMHVSIRGYSVTYFIVIIFQFYILHYLFAKYLKNIKALPIIIGSIILTSIYWSIRLRFPAPDNMFGQLVWGKEGQTIFLGWLTYFLLGYYIGKNYTAFKNSIQKYTVPIISLLVFSIIFVYYIHTSGFNSAIGSKRIDTPIYTTSIILVFFLLSSWFTYVPKFILFISNFSFSIYLMHLIFLNKMTMLSEIVYLDILYKFIVAVCLSVAVSYLFNLSKYGKYFVGNVNSLTHYELHKYRNTNNSTNKTLDSVGSNSI